MKVVFLGRKITSNVTAVVSNTSWLVADRLLRMAVGFVLGVWIARYLGVAEYGLFSYATAFVYLFNPLVTLGLDNIVVRDIVQDPNTTGKSLGTAFGLRLMGSCIALLLAISTISIFRPNDSLLLGIVAILSISGIFQSMDVIDLWFQSQVKSKYTVFSKTIAFSCIALVKVGLIISQAPLIAFAWTSLAEISLGAIALAIIYRIRGHLFESWQWDFHSARKLLKDGLPLMLSSITIMIYMKVDQIMLGSLINDKSVGLYTAATRISEASYFIPSAILSSVTPYIYKARENSESEYSQYMIRLLRLMNAIGIGIAIPVTILAPAIIQVCYGDAYTQSSAVLLVHIWAAIFVFMGLATTPCLIIEGLTNLALQRTTLGAIVNIGLNLVLIPRYTIVGAAIATVISQAIASYFSHALYPKTWKLFQLQTRSLIFFK